MASLHERIRTDIESRILTGELSPGERLPIELDLMRKYGCARMTVNKALSALSAEGLIERRKRAGTFVRAPRLHSMVLDVPDLQQDVMKRGHIYNFKQLTRKIRMPRKTVPGEIALAKNGTLLEIQGLHFSNNSPLAFEERLVSLFSVPEIAEADLTIESPGTWLLRHIPWTEVETRISAMNAGTNIAQILAVDQGAACLSVERKTWRGEAQITSVHQIFKANAYDLIARFSANASNLR